MENWIPKAVLLHKISQNNDDIMINKWEEKKLLHELPIPNLQFNSVTADKHDPQHIMNRESFKFKQQTEWNNWLASWTKHSTFWWNAEQNYFNS